MQRQKIGRRSQCLLPVIFVILALPSTLLFAFLIPPFQVPDAPQHYWYAKSISLGDFLPRQIDDGSAGAGGIITSSDRRFWQLFSKIPLKANRVTDEMLTAARELPGDAPTEIANYWGAAIYPPTAYAPSAMALFVSRHLGLDMLTAFYAGRVASALAYVLLGAFAIWLTPAAKAGFMFVLLLPMALAQAASFSADAGVFALSALFCALLARQTWRDSPDLRALCLCALLLVMTAATKAPLIALVIPLVAVSWRRSPRLAVALGMAVLVVFAYWMDDFVMTAAQATRQKVVGDIDTARQLHFLLSSPFTVLSIALHTIETHYWFYVTSLFGIFGWLDTRLADWFYYIAFLCTSAVLVATATEKQENLLRCQVPFACGGVLAVALTFGALYLSWTPVGAAVVAGVQGRYFIPILFPVFIGLAGVLPLVRWPASLSIVPVLVLWIVSSAYVPLALVQRYYLN
jgi:hypothetical protein